MSNFSVVLYSSAFLACLMQRKKKGVLSLAHKIDSYLEKNNLAFGTKIRTKLKTASDTAIVFVGCIKIAGLLIGPHSKC